MGRVGVIDQAVASAAKEAEIAREGAGGDTLDLFAIPSRHAPDSWQGQRVAQIEANRADEIERDRARGGRPKGSQNKVTQAFREYLLARGGSPLERMTRWMQHTPETLAAELGCTKLEAYDRLMKLWTELAPYLHSRLAPTDGQGQAVPLLNVVLGGGARAVAPGGSERPPWDYDGLDVELREAEEYQQLIGSTLNASDDSASDDTAK